MMKLKVKEVATLKTIIHNATKEEQGFIDSQLVNFNSSKVPFVNPYLPISRCIKEGNEVVGGILAQVYCWDVLGIDVLWVKEDCRNKGYATALIKDVEETAIKNGCKLSHLDTFDFQARGFYEKLGYTVFGILEDCPEGHYRYYMSKRLKPTIKENLRNYYNQEAELRNLSEKQGWKNEERKAFLDLIKSEGKQTLLELGAGTGTDSLYFMENSLTVTAIDLSPQMVKKCEEKSIDAHELDYYQVAKLGKKFHSIWAMNSLLHVPKADMPRVLSSIDSVLEESGLFYMGVYGGENSEEEYIKKEVSEHPRFFSSYDKETLYEVLAKHFQIISFQEYDVHRGRSYQFQSVIMRKRVTGHD